MRSRDHILVLGLSLAVAVAALVARMPPAYACGCLSPPAPPEGVSEFAVNQRAEQIIFEVEPGWVTAHVLIKYAGDPASFAWIVPVPEAPELSISPVSAFGLLDSLTGPDVTATVEDICPVSEWACRYHERPNCGGGGCGGGAANSAGDDSAGAQDAGAGGDDPPVTIIDEQVVGDYQTVTFTASEAVAATQWLRSNGFIVNPTTSIYMESYVQANMVFVAAKLVPGAGIDAIKPLRLRYRAAYPQVPLVLTAVAAEPHLTVTSFIYSDRLFVPQGHPVVTIDPARIAQDATGRLNYPMVLARTIDEAGGDGFAVEYSGPSVRPEFGGASFCCGNGFDTCGIGVNGTCECPRDEFDQSDCAELGDLVEGIALVDDLNVRYAALTRITTRVSPEEMSFDPAFEPDFDATGAGRMVVRGNQPSLTACTGAVIDGNRQIEIDADQGCAALYCGAAGECVVTAEGAGCECDAGFVAQRFIDVDLRPSVTCVPRVPTCDLRAGGDILPDACATATCGSGECIDRNGIAVCECDAGTAAIAGTSAAPRCLPFGRTTGTPGAEDYSEPLRDLAVCAPQPPTCGAGGWLARTESPRPGVACGNTDPPLSATIAPLPEKCGVFGGACAGTTNEGGPGGTIVVGWLVLVLVTRRRRGAR